MNSHSPLLSLLTFYPYTSLFRSGLHPYFRRRPETEMRFEADHVLLSGADPLPTGISAPAEHFGDWIAGAGMPAETDRKSTRLNSSHLVISYAVFCLKKKINIIES